MKTILFLMAGLFFVSCQQPVANKTVADKTLRDTLASDLLSQIEGFSIPFNKDFSDSNTLAFVCLPSFGNYYFLHVHKERNSIHGILYEVPRWTYHMAPGKFASESRDTLAFQGYSFRIDSLRWNGLINKADTLLKEKALHPEIKSGCCDGTTYYCAYDNQIVMGGNLGDSIFEVFTQYVEDSLLNHYIKRK